MWFLFLCIKFEVVLAREKHAEGTFFFVAWSIRIRAYRAGDENAVNRFVLLLCCWSIQMSCDRRSGGHIGIALKMGEVFAEDCL